MTRPDGTEPGIDCQSCGSPENAYHKPGCAVTIRLSQLEKALRMHDDPANFARIDLPFEELPDGPLLVGGQSMGLDQCIVSGGVTIKSTVLDIPGLGWQPAIIYSFSRAD